MYRGNNNFPPSTFLLSSNPGSQEPGSTSMLCGPADPHYWLLPARDLGHLAGHTDPKLSDERVLLVDLVSLL
jgi:hypothetical protein